MKTRFRFSFSILFHLYLLLWLHKVHLHAEQSEQWVTQPHLHARAGSVSSDGKILAYVIDQEGSSELWIKYLSDEGNGVKIFTATGMIESPHWSASKSFLVFSVKENNTGRIYRKNLSTNDPPVSLTPPGINCFHPAISPDESMIAYDSDEGGNYDIWTMDLKTFQRRQITHYQNHDFYPTFSPDGKSIAYTSFRNQSFHLFFKDLSIPDSRPVQLTQGEMISAHPAFSPAGDGIYFDSNQGGGNHIYFLNLENYATYQVTEGKMKSSFPVPGDQILVYESEESGVRGVRMSRVGKGIQSHWKKLTPSSEFDPNPPMTGMVVSKSNHASFEKDIDRIRIEKGDLIKNPTMPNTQFEETNFQLDFAKADTVEGIVVGESEASPKKGTIRPILSAENSKSPLDILRDSLPVSPPMKKGELDPIPAARNAPIAPALMKGTPVQSNSPEVMEEFFQPRMPELVRGTIPSSGSDSVDLFQPISLILDRDLRRGEEGYLTAKLYEDGQEIPVKTRYQKEHRRIDLVPSQSLLPGTKYRIVAGQAAFEFSTKGVKPVYSASGVPAPSPKNSVPARPLKISRVFPKHQSRNNKVHNPIRIRFSSQLDPDTIHASSVAIYKDGKQVPGELTFETNDRELTLKPYRNLEEASVYEVMVDSTLRSKNGLQLDGPREWKFKTEHFTPFLIEKFPRTVMDAVDQPLTIQLNREVDPASIRSEEFFLQGENFQYKGRMDLQDNGRALVFKPYQRIPDQQEYQFYISPNLRDSDGNTLQNNKTLTISSRFTASNVGKRTIARAREYFPRERKPQDGNENFLPILEQFSKKGYIQSKEPLHWKEGQHAPNRYQVARWIEESLSSIGRMSSHDKQELKTLLRVYHAELRNLGVDLSRWYQEIEGSTRSSSRPVSRFRNQSQNDFVSRGRRL